MNIIQKKLEDITPYENNPRKNEDATKVVVESIRQFGFRVPIVIDGDGVIIAGHTRYKAAKELGMTEIPAVIADDLTDEQIRAFRIADNKTAEFAAWDFDKLHEELEKIEGIDMELFGIDEQYDMEQLDSLFTDAGDRAEKEPEMITCPNCGHEFER